tara:strand:+ start:18335 stop:18964 length:630 start_codon:yes stop_codon:yes gene_type:complete
MESSTKSILEETLFVWSVINNTVIRLKHGSIIGRSHPPFDGDQYLDKEHLEFQLESGTWHVLGKETTNGTQLNNEDLDAGAKIALTTFDVLLGGDQIIVVLGKDLVKISEREEFLKSIKLTSDKYAEQIKTIQTRSVAFFKLEYPNFVKLIKRTELLKKVELAQAKKQNDLKPFDERIAQLKAKRDKIEKAWNEKINEFTKAASNFKDE